VPNPSRGRMPSVIWNHDPRQRCGRQLVALASRLPAPCRGPPTVGLSGWRLCPAESPVAGGPACLVRAETGKCSWRRRWGVSSSGSGKATRNPSRMGEHVLLLASPTIGSPGRGRRDRSVPERNYRYVVGRSPPTPMVTQRKQLCDWPASGRHDRWHCWPMARPLIDTRCGCGWTRRSPNCLSRAGPFPPDSMVLGGSV